jgi:putative acetyltransferase
LVYALRPFRDGDAASLAAIAIAAIGEVGVRHYTPEQVAAWANRHPGPAMYRDRAAKGHAIIVAVDETDRPVAYAVLEPDGYVDRLYNHPDHTRRGLAAQLLAAVEATAREAGLERLFTEASELARPSFERAGYAMIHRRDFAIDGVAIHNYAMERCL